MGYGAEAWIVGAHFAALVWLAVAAVRFARLAVAARLGEAHFSMLAGLPLVLTCVCVKLFVTSVYFAAARLHGGIEADLVAAFGALGALVMLGSLTLALAMPAYWRLRGLSPSHAARRALWDVAVLLGLWAGAVGLLW